MEPFLDLFQRINVEQKRQASISSMPAKDQLYPEFGTALQNINFVALSTYRKELREFGFVARFQFPRVALCHQCPSSDWICVDPQDKPTALHPVS